MLRYHIILGDRMLQYSRILGDRMLQYYRILGLQNDVAILKDTW